MDIYEITIKSYQNVQKLPERIKKRFLADAEWDEKITIDFEEAGPGLYAVHWKYEAQDHEVVEIRRLSPEDEKLLDEAFADDLAEPTMGDPFHPSVGMDMSQTETLARLWEESQTGEFDQLIHDLYQHLTPDDEG